MRLTKISLKFEALDLTTLTSCNLPLLARPDAATRRRGACKCQFAQLAVIEEKGHAKAGAINFRKGSSVSVKQLISWPFHSDEGFH